MDKQQVILEFKKHLNEYINIGSTISEVGNDDMTPQDGQQDNLFGGDMGGDPTQGGQVGGDMGIGPDAGMPGPEQNQAPGQEGETATPPEGFAPQGVDPNSGIDGMGGQEADNSQMPPQPESTEEEEVIDVDDLTDSQEETEKKIDSLNHKFTKLMDTVDSISKKIETMGDDTNKYISSLKDEFEKRNPTPMQRMSMRSTKSTPYNVTTDEYMNNYAPDNYSQEDDNNGADDPQYKITRNDVDGFSDYASIERELDNKRSLRDILGF